MINKRKMLFSGSFILLIPFIFLPFLSLQKSPESMSKEASDPVAFQDAVRDSAERDDIAMPVGLWSYTNKKNDSVIAIRIQDDGRFVLQILAPKVNEQGEVIDSVVVANLEGVFKIKGAVLMADKLIGEKKLLPASGLLVVRLVNNEHLVLEDDKKLSSIYFTKG